MKIKSELTKIFNSEARCFMRFERTLTCDYRERPRSTDEKNLNWSITDVDVHFEAEGELLGQILECAGS